MVSFQVDAIRDHCRRLVPRFAAIFRSCRVTGFKKKSHCPVGINEDYSSLTAIAIIITIIQYYNSHPPHHPVGNSPRPCRRIQSAVFGFARRVPPPQSVDFIFARYRDMPNARPSDILSNNSSAVASVRLLIPFTSKVYSVLGIHNRRRTVENIDIYCPGSIQIFF